jgi:mono/diheme cytochrome c family protein
MKTQWILVGAGGIGAALLLSSFLGVFEKRVDYNTQVKPLLNKNCIACHGGVKKASGFSLLFKQEALAPAKSGKLAIVPGDADASEMIRRLTLDDPDERMPLDHPALKPDDIDLLRKWIDQGAEWGDHWAYQSVEKPDVPKIGTFWSRLGFAESDETNWAKNEIDHFILDKLKQEKLTPSPEADRATLIRRVSFDLTGLPPTEKETADFVNDKSANAYEKVIDRLLKSPAYGERWTGMWLDLARYADTKGYERDAGRKIWRYRDWVIKSFNTDKPFNQFAVEQLAGDLLPNRTDDQLIATGFHRNTMTNDEGGTQDEEFRIAAVLDRVNTTWDVFQGTTFACIQCHSHPYDPFTHDEYYKYLAFFNNTRDEDVTSDTPTLRFYKPADSLKLASLQQYILGSGKNSKQAQVTANQVTQLARIVEPKINSHDFDQLANASLIDAKFFGFQDKGLARIKNVTMTGRPRLLIAWGTKAPDATVTIRQDTTTGPVLATLRVPKTGNQWNDTIQMIPLPQVQGKHSLYLSLNSPKMPKEWVMIKWVSFQPILPGQPQNALGEQDRLLLDVLNADAEQSPVMLDGSGDLTRETHVFDRGNWMVKGKRVSPDVPKSFPAMNPKLPRNRLGLAQWMVSREHPLTARVAVNRFWEQLFGAGIVETVEDMGTQGIPPTHRELLDYLAVEFMETDQWSVKKLLKKMVMSATYRQQSNASPEMLAKDPFNKLLARGPRVRLSAEAVHDQALAVSGLLSKKMFGPSVMPTQPDGIWQSPYDGEKWKQSTGEDLHRRALYTYWKRTAPYPSMVTFDSPSREFCQLRRLRTNTPLQALVTLNDPVYVEAAQHLATYMNQQGPSPERQIQAGFRQIMLRDLSSKKLAVLVRLYKNTEQYYRQKPGQAENLLDRPGVDCSTLSPQLAALTVTANTMLNLDEVITKE